MMDNKGRLKLPCVLTVVFIVLKLVGVIDWSWWWVLSPALIAIVIDIIVVVWMALYISSYTKLNKTPSKKKGGEKDA